MRPAKASRISASHWISASAFSLQGAKRRQNEDRFYISRHNSVFVVADGMGGCPAGDVASQLTVDVLAEELTKSDSIRSRRQAYRVLNDAIQKANTQVLQFGRNHGSQGMGAAVVAAVRDGNRVYIASVGDCRVYLFRQGELQCLTTDDTLANMISKSRDLDPEIANRHAFKSLLVRFIGAEQLEPVNKIVVVDLCPGDRLMLCSDGLANALGDAEVKTALLMTDDTKNAADQLQQIAKAANASDDTTCLIVDAKDDAQHLGVSEEEVGCHAHWRIQDMIQVFTNAFSKEPGYDR